MIENYSMLDARYSMLAVHPCEGRNPALYATRCTLHAVFLFSLAFLYNPLHNKTHKCGIQTEYESYAETI